MKQLRPLFAGLALIGAAGAVALSAATGVPRSAGLSSTGGALRSAEPASASSGTGSSGLALRAGATLAPPKVLDLGPVPAGITEVITGRDTVRPAGSACRSCAAGTSEYTQLQIDFRFHM